MSRGTTLERVVEGTRGLFRGGEENLDGETEVRGGIVEEGRAEVEEPGWAWVVEVEEPGWAWGVEVEEGRGTQGDRSAVFEGDDMWT